MITNNSNNNNNHLNSMKKKCTRFKSNGIFNNTNTFRLLERQNIALHIHTHTYVN